MDTPPNTTTNTPPDPDAPLFAQFWLNSELNPARGRLLRERIEADTANPLPTPEARWPQAVQALPAPHPDQQALWSRRRSVRAFLPLALSAAQVSHLLWPFAVRAGTAEGWRHLASGGGKYPLLLHWLWWRAADAEPGRYAYDPASHGLARTGDVPDWPQTAAILGLDTPLADSPAGALVITARPAAMLAKYGERGGRFTVLEAGSYFGALQVQAAQAGLVTLAVGSFDDRRLLGAVGALPGDLLLLPCLVGHAR